MTAKVQVRRSAKGDIADAHAWYETEQPGLGMEFLDEVAATLARIASGPERYPLVEADVRRALVRRFPYSVYFRLKGESARVIAVIHQHRDPRVWRRRARR